MVEDAIVYAAVSTALLTELIIINIIIWLWMKKHEAEYHKFEKKEVQ
jgi:hypothetical protein